MTVVLVLRTLVTQRPDVFIRPFVATTIIFAPPIRATLLLAAFSPQLSAHPVHFAPMIPVILLSDAFTVVLSAMTITLLRPTLVMPRQVVFTPQLAVTMVTTAPQIL